MAINLWRDLSIYTLGDVKDDMELLHLWFTLKNLSVKKNEAKYYEEIERIRGKIVKAITALLIEDKYFTMSARDKKARETWDKKVEAERKMAAKRQRDFDAEAERREKRARRAGTRFDDYEPVALDPEPVPLPAGPMSRHDRHATPAASLYEAVQPVALAPEPMSLSTFSRSTRARQATPAVPVREAAQPVALVPQPMSLPTLPKSRGARPAEPASLPPPALTPVSNASAASFQQQPIASAVANQRFTTATTDKERRSRLETALRKLKVDILRDVPYPVDWTYGQRADGTIIKPGQVSAIVEHARLNHLWDEMLQWATIKGKK